MGKGKVMFLRNVSALAAAVFTAAAASGAMVDGYCYLECPGDPPCHGLTTVELDGSALHLPQSTDCSGYFGPFTFVLPGWHTFTYAHVGYEPYTLVYNVPAVGATLPPVTLESKALCECGTWRDYPYTLPGTSIIIPHDEGRHDPTSTFRVEWWYLNFHVTAEDGRRYAGVVSFFKPPIIGSPGMVLFSVIDLEDGTFQQGARYPLVCDADEESLCLQFGVPPFRDWWCNKECEGVLLPFDYHISMDWTSDGIGWLEFDLGALKPPLPVSGDGFVEFPPDAWSYYYSHPQVDILGSMHLPGFPLAGKTVQGYGWIDHQWANLPTDAINWEWLSIQLDDQRDIMVADVWINGQQQGSFSGGLNYYDEDCVLDVLADYTLTPLRCWCDPEYGTYTTQWRVYEPTRQIDLIVTAEYEYQVIETTGQILGLHFWEGACTVAGTIDGQPAHGTAFAESTHWWPPPTPEACCMDDGTCRYLPPYLCTAQGGTPKGTGTTCATTPCPQACCLTSGTCVMLTPDDCAAQGGQPLGPGAVCEPEEACCLADQGCQMLAPVCCLEHGGFPQGPGPDCNNPALCDLGCCPASPFGNGVNDHTVGSGTTLILTGDASYHNLTVDAGGTIVTNGHTLSVCGTLLNLGTIKGGFSGAGGTGGAGGKGGNPKGEGSDPTGCGRTYSNCTSGQSGGTGTGRGGDGGCGGGGGGGAWSDDLLCTFDADGGNGGAGGHGGHGSADVTIYAFRIDNNGLISADGESGADGNDAPSGDSTDPNGYESCGAEYYHCPVVSKDLAGGGGGGGQGGDGGDAGNIHVYYGILLNQGLAHANPGQGGSGGQGGSKGGCLDHGVNDGGRQLGCSGCEAHGAGGRGAYQDGDCATDGDDGADGASGAAGVWQFHAVTFPDCNENGFPDQCELYHGTSADCQPNGFPDECDIADGTSSDCQSNGIPDECDIASGTSDDCDENGVPDECQTDTDHDGVIDPCDNCPYVYNPGQEDVCSCVGDMNCDGTIDFGDINPFVLYLSNPPGWQAANPDCDPKHGDINCNGLYYLPPDFGDINPFVALLTQCSGGCPCPGPITCPP
jgi:predicted secreted hydrolase